MKIIKIQKKPWYLRIKGIEYWWVWVEDLNHSVKRYSVWAGINEPSKDDLLIDLKGKIAKELKSEESFQSLVGQDVEIDVTTNITSNRGLAYYGSNYFS